MDMRNSPLKHNIMLESDPLRPTMLVGRLGVEELRQPVARLFLDGGAADAAARAAVGDI